MGIFTFFRVQKPRRYNPKFRYYDEHKERLKESEERVRKKLAEESGKAAAEEEAEKVNLSRSSERIHSAYREGIELSREDKKAKTRMGLLIGAAIIIIVVFLQYAF